MRRLRCGLHDAPSRVGEYLVCEYGEEGEWEVEVKLREVIRLDHSGPAMISNRHRQRQPDIPANSR